jgi:hypothetical protein
MLSSPPRGCDQIRISVDNAVVFGPTRDIMKLLLKTEPSGHVVFRFFGAGLYVLFFSNFHRSRTNKSENRCRADRRATATRSCT